jgi:hypothetical protein
MPDNTNLSRAEVANRLIRALGIEPESAGLLVANDGRIASFADVPLPAAISAQLSASDDELEQLDQSLFSSLNTQVASAGGVTPDSILDNPLMSLTSKLDLLERDLVVIKQRIAEYSTLADEALARGELRSAAAYQSRVAEYEGRLQVFQTAIQQVTPARDAQRFAESLYSNDRGFSRADIDAAMGRLLRGQLPVNAADDFVATEMHGRANGLWRALKDPEGLASILAAGSIGRAALGRTPSRNNYRDLFRLNRPELPPDWPVHHTLPQKYEKLMRDAGINIHEVQYLRGVDQPTHDQITTLWRAFDRRNGGNPTASQVVDFARQIDKQFGSKFIWPTK